MSRARWACYGPPTVQLVSRIGCRAPVLDPWFGCMWLHGHSKRLQAFACRLPQNDSSAGDLAEPDAAELSSCFTLRRVAEVHLDALSSTLPRFCSVVQKRYVPAL